MNTITKETLNSYERALQYAADQGIEIPDAIKQQAEAARIEAMQQEYAAIHARNASKGRFQRMMDSYIERYPKLQDGVTKLGNWLMALIKLFTVNIGATIIMFGVMVAEIIRVRAGLVAIEASPLAVELLSIVLVFLLFFLEVAGFYMEREAGYEQPKRVRWSLRILMNDVKYTLGIGKHWQEREISPATRMIFTKWFIQLAVAFIALYGSMVHVIKGHGGNWGQAFQDILANSSLDEMATWNIGLLLTIGILFGSTAMIWFVASRAKLLEDADFAVGEDKIELLGVKRAADAITTFTTTITRQRREQRDRLRAGVSTPVSLPPTPATASPALLHRPATIGGSIPVNPAASVNPVKRATRNDVKAWFEADRSRLQLKSREAQTAMAAEGIFTSHTTANAVRDELVNQTP